MRRKLLLVEDNPDHAILTRLALQKTGYEHDLLMVQNAEELLEYLFREGRYAGLNKSDMPDLVFLDLGLPKMDGLTLLAKLKGDSRTRSIPIVMLSVSNARKDVLESYRLGANSYVCKRLNAEDFQTTLKDLLAYWFDFVKLPPRVCVDHPES